MKEVKDLIVNRNPFSVNELESYFDESLEDNTFKKVVSKIKLPKRELIKYTSLIKDSCNELKHCENCPNIMECKNTVTGHVYYPSVEQGTLVFSYVPCKYKKKLDKDNMYQKNVVLMDMPKEILSASMKNIYTDDKNRLETIKWLTTFIKRYEAGEKCKGLYLTGNFGCGKTYLVAASFNELAKKGKKVAAIYYPEFLRELKENFDDFSYNFNRVKKADLLLLDDIGAEKLTDWARDEILGSILQYRMDFKLPTFFTSNLTTQELENHLQINMSSSDKIKARRIIERIKFLTDEVSLIGINRRSE